MARRFTGRGGAIKPPQRQIANDGLGIGFSGAVLTFGASADNKTVNSVGLLHSAAASTLVRTRGWLQLSVEIAGLAPTRIVGAMGMIIVSEDAFLVGITALPGPLSDIENDWFVWQPWTLHSDAVDPTGNDVISNFSQAFDSRGMRKLKAGQVLAIVWEASQSHATAGTVVNCTMGFRVQLKL